MGLITHSEDPVLKENEQSVEKQDDNKKTEQQTGQNNEEIVEDYKIQDE